MGCLEIYGRQLQEKYQEVQTSMEETARKEEEERKEEEDKRKERRREILVFLGYTSLMLGFLGLIVILGMIT